MQPRKVSRLLFCLPGVAAVALLFGLWFGDWSTSGRWWGINHLQFLPPAYTLFVSAVTIAVVGALLYAAFRGCKATSLSGASGLSVPLWLGLLLAGGSAVVFWSLRIPTHFLGDGFTALSNLSSEASYIRKWTEPLSCPLIRLIQRLLGSYSQTSARLAFQIVSVVSGFVVVLTLPFLVNRLVRRPQYRLLCLTTLLFSGAVLLFFGYVEYYPLLWAAVVLYLLWAIRYLQDNRVSSLLVALGLYALAALIHVQALWLGGTVLWLVLSRSFVGPDGDLRPRLAWVASGCFVLGVAAGYIWLLAGDETLSLIVLPPVAGRPHSPEYATLSPSHLVDLLNLTILVFPALLPLLVARLTLGRQDRRLDSVGLFFLISSIGGASFLLLVDPVLGLARDWDLMSLAFLPIILWLWYSVDRAEGRLDPQVLLPTALLSIAATVCFLAVYADVASAENRQLSLLRHYAGKDYPGWKIFHGYLVDSGRIQEAADINLEMQRVLPHYAELADAWAMLARGRTDTVAVIADRLVREDPYHAEFLHLRGQVAMTQGDTASARADFLRALAIKPNFPPVLRGLAQLSLRQDDLYTARNFLKQARHMDPRAEQVLDDLGAVYLAMDFPDSADAAADTLLVLNPQSAGGHLIKLVGAVKARDFPSARRYYQLYREYGKDRPEYSHILSAYAPLADGQ